MITMLRAQKHKQQCLVWVNLRVIHNKRIWQIDVADFIGEKFPSATSKERGQYYKWIRAFSKDRYDKGNFKYWSNIIIDDPVGDYSNMDLSV